MKFLDFEGEPARSLGERRLKRSALRDVAGMIRSFEYAAGTAVHDAIARGAQREGSAERAAPGTWADLWSTWVTAAYVKGYREVAKGSGFHPETEEEEAALLDAFVLDKAVYELGYELENRPEWVELPLEGIVRHTVPS